MKHRHIQLAEILDTAALTASATDQLTAMEAISLNDAYEIQKELLHKRALRGEHITGIKLGFTSKAKMKQMGVHDLIWGRLTDAMEIKNHGTLDTTKFIHPRAEPEIAFLIKKDITGHLNKEEALTYIDALAPAIEIIDSRYKNFKFTLEDVVADNCSSAAYVLGDWIAANTDVSNLELNLSINGKVIEAGNTNAILGNPIHSFIEATRLATQFGVALNKGMIVLAGAATPATFFQKNDYIEANFKNLNKVAFNVQ